MHLRTELNGVSYIVVREKIRLDSECRRILHFMAAKVIYASNMSGRGEGERVEGYNSF
jgi:hypothetical protein